MTKNIDFKFNEREIMDELIEFISKTYSSHYANSKEGKQTLEIISSAGLGVGFVIGHIMEYATKYGKDKWNDRENLFKLAHYVILLIAIHDFKRPMLTQRYIHDLMDYDEDTGIAVWKKNRGGNRAGDRVGSLDDAGYRTVTIDEVKHKFSHIVWLYCYGWMPNPNSDRPVIDHEFKPNDDDRLSNLRLATRSENNYNRGKTTRHKHPELQDYKGVRKTPQGRFRAEIRYNKIFKHLGVYDTREEAHEAWKKAAIKYHGEFRNFGTRGEK